MSRLFFMTLQLYRTHTDADPLLKAFHATHDDLLANRVGSLGADQADRLRRSARWNVVAALCGDALLIALMLAVAERPFKAVQLLVAGTVAAALLAVGIATYVKLRRAAEARIVERVSGVVRVVRRGKAGFFLVVGDRDFRSPVRPWSIANGESYHVYYTPEARRVVAMERYG